MSTFKPIVEGRRLMAGAASAVVICSAAAVKVCGLEPHARIDHLSVHGNDPGWRLTAPIAATAHALK